MAKGSIRFNNDINVEVDVDPAADEGARLTSAKNLVDGQELGVGGADLPEVTAADEGKVLAVNDSGEWAAENRNGICIDNGESLNKSYNDLVNMVQSGILPFVYFDGDGPIELSLLIRLLAGENIYEATFITVNANIIFYTAATADALLTFSE